MKQYGWTWIEGEDDDEGTSWITIQPLSDDGQTLSGDEMAVIICRNYAAVEREHPEWIEHKEDTARQIVAALNYYPEPF